MDLLTDAHRSIDSSIRPLIVFYFVDNQSVCCQQKADSIPVLLVAPIVCFFSNADTAEQ